MANTDYLYREDLGTMPVNMSGMFKLNLVYIVMIKPRKISADGIIIPCGVYVTRNSDGYIFEFKCCENHERCCITHGRFNDDSPNGILNERGSISMTFSATLASNCLDRNAEENQYDAFILLEPLGN